MLNRRRLSASSTTTQAFATFMGHELVINLDFEITHFGAAPTWDDPGEDPEWEFEINSIQIDNEGELGPEHVPTGAFLRVIENLEAINDAILREMDHMDFSERYWD